MSVNARIAKFCEYKGIKQKELSEWGLGTAQTINDIFNDKVKPGYKFIIFLLEKYTELSARWLLMGEGEMIIEQDLNQANESDELYKARLIERLEEDKAYLKNLLNRLKEESKELNDNIYN